jgi:thiosulfate dehydrogenase
MKLNWKEDWPLYLIVLTVLIVITRKCIHSLEKDSEMPMGIVQSVNAYWVAPIIDFDKNLSGIEREKVIYGEDIIAQTSSYFGPGGKIASITNGMNCQNCHLQAGRQAWGNNYSAVYSTYPKYRDRSGSLETIAKRVNDCFERSLNGLAIDTNGKEMQSIIAYMKWLGQDVKKGEKPQGAGIRELSYLNRAADPVKGKELYRAKCQSCHADNGQGVSNPNSIGYVYPPLWGENSYNTGAGLFRLSRLAGYIKDNMPFNQSSHDQPNLTDEEAWDIAAFVNSQSRPTKDISKDWPDISKKPIDHPFGPYADGFNEVQHKYGPFPPIIEARKKK